MSACRRVAAILSLMLVGSVSSPCATAQAFDAEQTQALEELVRNAVVRALDDPSVGDGDPRTHPPATVFRADETPGLNEAQRIQLAQMVDDAIQRTMRGAASAQDATAAVSRTAPRPPQSDEASDPVIDLTEDSLSGRRTHVLKEQGLNVKKADVALYESQGGAATALALSDTGLNAAQSAPPTSNLQIIATGDGSRASLRVDLSASAADPIGNTVYWARSLVLSAPLDKNDSLGTSLIGLDGLTNNFEMAYNVSRIQTEPLGRPRDGTSSLLFEMPGACTSLGIAINECDLSTLLRVAKATSQKPGADRASIVLAENAAKIAQQYSITGRAWLQGFRFKAGYDNFTFFDPDSLTKRSRNKVPWSTGAFIGVLSETSYYSAGLDYQRTYKAATSGTACPLPEPGATLIHCVSGALDAPSSKEKHLATLEGRWLFGARAVGIKIVRDFKNDNWGIDVPLYLFPNDKGMLTGGLRLGWTNTDQFSAGVFVGVPFKLLD